jgi:hypothetical protein
MPSRSREDVTVGFSQHRQQRAASSTNFLDFFLPDNMLLKEKKR